MRKIKNLLFILSILFILTGYTYKRNIPKNLYHVYLKGESIGLIESKSELEEYIDEKQQEIKDKYNVTKVYVPDELDIKKETTFSSDIKKVEEVYNIIQEKSPFTINGYVITINSIDSESESSKSTTQKKEIYVLDKDIFIESANNLVKSFISDEEYESYKNDRGEVIKGSGNTISTLVENIYIKNKITIRKTRISTDKDIYTDVINLSKFLLFGTTQEQNKYKIQDETTLEEVAFNNKVSLEELLIANPDLSSNSLLSPDLELTIGILKPQFSIVEETEIIFKEETNYNSETKLDTSKSSSYSEVTQAGQKGEDKVTQKLQKVNGETTNIVTVDRQTLKEPVTEIITKGTYSYSASTGSGYGNVVFTAGYWGWPATCSTVSSGFGYRWGTLHDGTDIAGCGYGSNIFAAQDGTVVKVASKFDNGNYVIIDHHNGYFTLYAHLAGFNTSEGANVTKGQVIGTMGATGYATGVHLHYAIWTGYPYYGGVALNAMNFY